MTGVVYPRRQDAVRFQIFDGSLASAQKIANLTGSSAYMHLDPNHYYYDGDIIQVGAIEIEKGFIKRTQVVVLAADGKLDILDERVFHDLYSKDGN